MNCRSAVWATAAWATITADGASRHSRMLVACSITLPCSTRICAIHRTVRTNSHVRSRASSSPDWVHTRTASPATKAELPLDFSCKGSMCVGDRQIDLCSEHAQTPGFTPKPLPVKTGELAERQKGNRSTLHGPQRHGRAISHLGCLYLEFPDRRGHPRGRPGLKHMGHLLGVARRYGDRVKRSATFNESSVFTLFGYGFGGSAPGISGPIMAM